MNPEEEDLFFDQSLHEEKFMHQFYLDTFMRDKPNHFEGPVDSIIKKLIQDKKLTSTKFKNLDQKLDELDTFENSDQTNISLQIERHECLTENFYRDQELLCLVEMKIIYLYKFFEINLKKLLKYSFSNVNTKELFRWDSIIYFLKGKGIDIKQVKNYHEISYLREVNNSLKHADYFDERLIKKIPEFKIDQEITYKELQKFYSRIKNAPHEFLISLSSFIIKELYEFDEDKINSLAESLILRMDKDDAKILIDRLKSEYGI